MQDYQAHVEKCEGVARFFDFIFAGGFGVLAVFWIILWMPCDSKGVCHNGIPDFVLLGYYIFFCLFMLGCVMRLDIIFKNMGFLDNVLYKSIFYAL